jgi:hypothetical protein
MLEELERLRSAATKASADAADAQRRASCDLACVSSSGRLSSERLLASATALQQLERERWRDYLAAVESEVRRLDGVTRTRG